jgi:hypothetical protein
MLKVDKQMNLDENGDFVTPWCPSPSSPLPVSPAPVPLFFEGSPLPSGASPLPVPLPPIPLPPEPSVPAPVSPTVVSADGCCPEAGGASQFLASPVRCVGDCVVSVGSFFAKVEITESEPVVKGRREGPQFPEVAQRDSRPDSFSVRDRSTRVI